MQPEGAGGSTTYGKGLKACHLLFMKTQSRLLAVSATKAACPGMFVGAPVGFPAIAGM